MKEKKIFQVGLIGSVIAAICCFTPVLVILFGVVGLSAFVYVLDAVLIPALVIFLGVAGYGVYLMRTKQAC